MSPKYRAYLLSPKWYKLREQVKKRDKNRCRVCKTTKNLHVHHLTYKRIYNEELKDLITLCSYHHRLIHERYTLKEKLQLFIAMTSFYVVLIATIVIVINRFN